MKVVSYNILADSAVHHLIKEGILLEYLDKNKRIEKVIKELKGFYDVDIYCLQEVEIESYKKISDELIEYKSKLSLKENKKFGVAIFWKNNKNLVENITEINFNDVSGQKYLCLDINGYKIYNVHLDFKLNISQIEKIIKTFKNDNKYIICGDFNSELTSKTLKKLYDIGFSTIQTKQTFIKCSVKKIIDFILVKDCVLKFCDSKIIYNNLPDQNNGSDHVPVLGIIE